MSPTRRNPSSSTPRAGLAADLLADLNAPTALPTATTPSAAASSAPTGGTPAFSVTVTPLRWRAPSLSTAERGTGVAVRVGPLRVELAY